MPSEVRAASQRPAELNRRNTTLIGSATAERQKPNPQGQMGTVHHRSGGNGDLVAAGTALADIPTANGIKFFVSAFRTHEAFRKTLAKQFFPAALFRVIPGAKFFEANYRRLCHHDILCFFSEDIIAFPFHLE